MLIAHESDLLGLFSLFAAVRSEIPFGAMEITVRVWPVPAETLIQIDIYSNQSFDAHLTRLATFHLID
jgi:hypothetical protein